MKDMGVKLLSDRRRRISNCKDTQFAQQRTVVHSGKNFVLQALFERWESVPALRYLVFPLADCFTNSCGQHFHRSKSTFLKYSTQVKVRYPLNELASNSCNHSSREGSNKSHMVSKSLYSGMPFPYSTIQIDAMNGLHYRGDSGQGGTTLSEIIVGKMISVLHPWLNGLQASYLKQIHLHVDNDSQIIPQKKGKQKRRDATRDDALNKLEFHLDLDANLKVPWNSLLMDRVYKK